MFSDHRHSLIAGAFAAGGSFFGKMPSFLALEPSTLDLWGHLYTIAFRLFPLVLMIFCNILNWRYFLKALQLSEQTLAATVLTSASNYMISFTLGFIVYQEKVTIITVIGSVLIIGGLWFLCNGQPPSLNQKKINIKEN